LSDRFYFDAGADGYDRSFGKVSPEFIPTLLRAANLVAGHRALDVATGTGVAAKAAAEIVGPSGHVVAADISVPILDQARIRLAGRANVSLAIEDGQALTFPEGSFDAVLCGMGLMLFPDPAQGLIEFHRVLREGGRAAVSVGTTPQRSFVARISAAIARHMPSKAADSTRFFMLGDAKRLEALFEAAGFSAIKATTETRRFPFPSFDAYFEPIDAGCGNVALEYLSLVPEVRRAVRDEVRRELEARGAEGGPIEVEVEVLYASGRK
jgi:ubiquinone/menaquinone biosynthesis C-methylase UbiE